METFELGRILRAALEREPRVDLTRDRINVEFGDGIVTLSGEVSDIAAKRLTLEAAAALPGIGGIVDRLHTRPAEPMGDGAIADHVEHALLRDSAFNQCGLRRHVGESRSQVRPSGTGSDSWWIELRVEDGVVKLDGGVPSLSHKRLAGVLAWWVPGCRDVINGLGVEPDEEDSDEEILDALRLVLDKDPLVDAAQVRASCTDSILTLEGLVASQVERHAADFDAWALFGIDKVVNRIEVRAMTPSVHGLHSPQRAARNIRAKSQPLRTR